MVGIDIPFPEPENPDLVIENNIDRLDFSSMLSEVLSLEDIKKLLK